MSPTPVTRTQSELRKKRTLQSINEWNLAAQSLGKRSIWTKWITLSSGEPPTPIGMRFDKPQITRLGFGVRSANEHRCNAPRMQLSRYIRMYRSVCHREASRLQTRKSVTWPPRILQHTYIYWYFLRFYLTYYAPSSVLLCWLKLDQHSTWVVPVAWSIKFGSSAGVTLWRTFATWNGDDAWKQNARETNKTFCNNHRNKLLRRPNVFELAVTWPNWIRWDLYKDTSDYTSHYRRLKRWEPFPARNFIWSHITLCGLGRKEPHRHVNGWNQCLVGNPH